MVCRLEFFYEIITIYAIAIFFFSHKKKFPVVGSKICSHLKVEVFIEEKPKGHCDYTESQKPQDEVDSEHQKLGMRFFLDSEFDDVERKTLRHE